MENDALCTTCTESFARYHEVEKEYDHHQSAESFHLAKQSGCHMCNNIWEVACGSHVDLKWDFRKAKELRFKYWIVVSGESKTICFSLDAEDKMMGSLYIELRPAKSIPTPAVPILAEGFPDRFSRGLHYSEHWLRECLQNHPACRELTGLNDSSYLPTRLLDIRRQDDDYISLRITDPSDKGPYLTLSHRWKVDPEPPKLLLGNVTSLQGGIKMDSLPASFRDAVRVARSLGGDWLWIDSLCIIQDSMEDWRAESSRMGDVYRHSLCNLAATGSAEHGDGFFLEDSIVATPLFLDLCILPPGTRDPERVTDASFERYRCEPESQWGRKIEDAVLNRRGWVVQERMLAPQTLHFTDTEVFWECLSLCAAESIPDTLSNDGPLHSTYYATTRNALALTRKRLAGGCNSSPLGPGDLQEVQDGWQELVRKYMHCVLTHEEDRLIAISGIAKEFKQATGDEYLAGLWHSTIIPDLLWNNMVYGAPRVRRRPLVAPTWSWASIKPYASVWFGEYGPEKCGEWQPLTEFVHCDVQACTDDETGQLRSATLYLRGRTFPSSRGQLPCQNNLLPTSDSWVQIEHLRFEILRTSYDEDCLQPPYQSALPVVCLPILIHAWQRVGYPGIMISMLWLIGPSSSGTYSRIGVGRAGVRGIPRAAYDEFRQRYLSSTECRNLHIE